MLTRTQARSKHTKLRAAQRYSVSINRKEIKGIIETIQKGGAVASQRWSHGVSLQIVTHHGVDIAVLYSKTHKELLACLPATDRRVCKLVSAL